MDTLIIGSGPAGYTAAIYAARADLKPVIYTGLEPGGQLTTTTDVDNFPGYPKGIDGPKMMDELKEQAERFGTEVKIDFISKVEFSKNKGSLHKVFSQDGTEIEAKTIIICTGASAKYLGLPSEQKLIGGGVSACAVCDGFFYKNQEVAVVGGGDTAVEEATYLAKICSKVTMIVRKDHLRASKAMQNRITKYPNISILYNHEVEEVIGDNVVVGIKTINNLTKETSEIKITGLFLAIGHTPNTSIFDGQLDLDEAGYIKIKSGTQETSIEGIFAAGDVHDHKYRQAITAAGTGCAAALEAERWLAEKGLGE